MPTKPSQHNARRAETVGLAIVALLILGITLVRYWHVIHWSLR